MLATASVCKSSGFLKAWCIANERQALLDFKQGLVVHHEDEDVKPLSSWTSTSQDCCSWERIRCHNQTNHVIMLILSMYHLGNEISPSLTQLKYLKSLDLSYNRFRRIPKFIGSFPKLKHLDLSINPLSETIPSQLGNITGLRSFDLSSEDGFITADKLQWLPHLSSLKTLAVASVHFTSASDWLRSIKVTPSLKSLEFIDCLFSDVDASSFSHINSSNSLTALWLSFSIIHHASVPWLLNISCNLVDLNLRFNGIEGSLPNSFGNLNSLQILDLSENQFEGGIPKSLGTLCKLKSLSLSNYKLNGTLCNLLGNQFSCPLNNSIDNLMLNQNQLEELFLDENLFEGPLPNSLSQFPSFLL